MNETSGWIDLTSAGTSLSGSGGVPVVGMSLSYESLPASRTVYVGRRQIKPQFLIEF